MGKCRTYACQRRQARMYMYAFLIIGVLGIGGFIVMPAISGKNLVQFITTLPGLPSAPVGATGQSVPFRVSAQLYGGSYPTYGTISFFDTSSNNWGGGSFSATTAGSLTTGAIATGYSYTMYFNGSSLWWPNTWSVSVPAVTGQSQPVNYYQGITMPNGAPFTIYPIATTYSYQIVNTAGATLTGAAKTTWTAAGVMANETGFTHSATTADTYSIIVTVGSVYSAVLPSYSNPAYPTSGTVGGYMYLITNQTNIQAASGCSVIPIWSGTTPWFAVVVPLSMVIAGPSAATYSASFGVLWPTQCHPQVYAYILYNTNLAQLTLAKTTTASAPTGYTIATNCIIGSSNAQHTYALWVIA